MILSRVMAWSGGKEYPTMGAGGAHSFGDLLRRHREAAGLTQGELAERANLSVRGLNTAFTHTQGDEAAARLASRITELVRESVAGCGGQLIELRGDEALAGKIYDWQSPRAAR
jgi:hypothetical protein